MHVASLTNVKQRHLRISVHCEHPFCFNVFATIRVTDIGALAKKSFKMTLCTNDKISLEVIYRSPEMTSDERLCALEVMVWTHSIS